MSSTFLSDIRTAFEDSNDSQVWAVDSDFIIESFLVSEIEAVRYRAGRLYVVFYGKAFAIERCFDREIEAEYFVDLETKPKTK